MTGCHRCTTPRRENWSVVSSRRREHGFCVSFIRELSPSVNPPPLLIQTSSAWNNGTSVLSMVRILSKSLSIFRLYSLYMAFVQERFWILKFSWFIFKMIIFLRRLRVVEHVFDERFTRIKIFVRGHQRVHQIRSSVYKWKFSFEQWLQLPCLNTGES